MKDPHEAATYIFKHSALYSQAKAERVYLEQFRKSKKALLMAQSDSKTAILKEMDAYSHSEYLMLLEGLKEAVRVEEELKWKIESAKLSIEIWKSNEFSNRQQDKVMK